MARLDLGRVAALLAGIRRMGTPLSSRREPLRELLFGLLELVSTRSDVSDRHVGERLQAEPLVVGQPTAAATEEPAEHSEPLPAGRAICARRMSSRSQGRQHDRMAVRSARELRRGAFALRRLEELDRVARGVLEKDLSAAPSL
jgi:hypothetical protein